MPLTVNMKGPIDLEPLFPERDSIEPLGAQLVRRLRRAVETGFFPPGSRLLASRELANRLGLARNTVTYALDQLVAEGYLEARVGSGTFVAQAVVRERKRTPANTELAVPESARELQAIRRRLAAVGDSAGPLRVGAPDPALFPLRAWQRLARRLLARHPHVDYGRSNGSIELRRAISQHIAQFRGVVADAEQIVVVEGAQAALDAISLVLARPGETIAVEDPCYAHARAVFEARGLVPFGVPVDDAGMQVERLPRRAGLAYVSPSHQFPLGGALPHPRRIALLDWARETNAYVIEDDYDSEFDLHPLPALQSLDRHERVVYVGTFSKTLGPGLRLGYIVAPPHLVPAFADARAVVSFGAPVLLQAMLAEFVADGSFSRHVRRTNAVYERRRRFALDVLSQTLPPAFRVGPAQTGLHLAILGPVDFDDVRAVNAMPHGNRCLPLSAMCVTRTDCKGVMAGFSSAPETAIGPALRSLVRVLARA